MAIGNNEDENLQGADSATLAQLSDTIGFVPGHRGWLTVPEAYLTLDQEVLGGVPKVVIMDLLYTDRIHETIVKMEKWGSSTIDRVAWEAYKRMFNKLGQGK
jgi:hypothetical protein